MKKLMLGLMMAFAVTADAEVISDVEIDGLNYSLDTETKTATITGWEGSPTKVDVAEVEREGQKYTVTSVLDFGLGRCLSLTSVSLPNVTTIGDRAFFGCENLSAFALPSVAMIGPEAFTGCSGLTGELTLPESVTSISAYAFERCTNLTSITILAGVTNIGMGAFSDCSNLVKAMVQVEKPPMGGTEMFLGASTALRIVVPAGSSREYRGAQFWSDYAEKIWEFYPAGDTVMAYWNCATLLSIEGTGAMDDFVGAASVPWAAVAKDLSAVTVADGVTYIGKNAFAGIADTVTVNGTALSVYDMMAGARGSSEPDIPDNMVLVTKESIQAAKAETISIANNEIHLGVSVLSNSDITASTAWTPVKFTEDTQIGLSADGTKLVLPIPVAAQQGFMILQSGDAKAVPADGEASGFYMIKVVQ